MKITLYPLCYREAFRSVRVLAGVISRHARLVAAVALMPLFADAAPAENGFQAQPVPLPKGNGYILADGSLQIVGNGDMSGIVEGLDAYFVKLHPEFKFKFLKADNLAAAQSMVYDTTAFAPMSTDSFGSATTPYEFIAKAPQFGIRIAHASLNPAATVSPMAIIVHKSNPLETLTTAQIARIYTSGGRKWDITHWGQVGMTGAWAHVEIHPCGLPESNHYPSEDSEFADFMFLRKIAGNQPALNYDRFPNYADVVKKVNEDPAAIGITALNRVSGNVKVVGIVSDAWSGASYGSKEDIVAGKYPYDRYLYIFVRRAAGKPVEPYLKEYLRLVLSREGQQIIANDSRGYLPLNPLEVATEMKKLQ